MGLEIENIRTEYESSIQEGKHAYIMSLRSKVKLDHEELFKTIRDIPGVAYVEGL